MFSWFKNLSVFGKFNVIILIIGWLLNHFILFGTIALGFTGDIGLNVAIGALTFFFAIPATIYYHLFILILFLVAVYISIRNKSYLLIKIYALALLLNIVPIALLIFMVWAAIYLGVGI